MTACDTPTALHAALERARLNLQSPPFAPIAAAVEEVCAFLAATPGTEPPRTVLALISLHPSPSEARLQENLAALEYAKRWLDEAYTLTRMPGSAKPDTADLVLEAVDRLMQHVDLECERHRASIERRRVAAELATLAQDTARWLSALLPGRAWSSRLERASEFLVMGYVALAPSATDRNEIEGKVSVTEQRLLQTLEGVLTRLLALDLDGVTFYESLVLRYPARTIDDATMRQVLDGLAWVLRAVQGILRPDAPAPGTAPTQPAPADDASPDPNAEAFAALCEARDYAFRAQELNLDPEVFRPDLAGAIEDARGEIRTALRMVAPEGATDLDTPRSSLPLDAPHPGLALMYAHGRLLSSLARLPADAPMREPMERTMRALHHAVAESVGDNNRWKRCEIPTPGEGLTHNQRVTLEHGLRVLTEAHAYACQARDYGEDDESPDGAALECVCAEVWDARDLVRRLLEEDRAHLHAGWDRAHVLTRRTYSARRALVVLHETLTEWLDDAAPRRQRLHRDTPDEVLQAVRGALLSVDRLIIARTAYTPATAARRFLGGALMRLARAVRP